MRGVGLMGLRILLAALVLSPTAPAQQGEPRPVHPSSSCLLQVLVMDAEGRAVPGELVGVYAGDDPSAKDAFATSTRSGSSGAADFCDLAPGSYTVFVGGLKGSSCPTTTVTGVWIDFYRSHKLRVQKLPCPGVLVRVAEGQFLTGCFFQVRLRDRQGASPGPVELLRSGQAWGTTDDYGRFQVRVPLASSIAVEAVWRGARTSFLLPCAERRGMDVYREFVVGP